MTHLKKVYGRSAMSEVMQDAINNGVNQTLAERAERAATSPRSISPRTRPRSTRCSTARPTSPFDVSYEVLPPVELMDFTTLAYDRPTVESTRRMSTSRSSAFSATIAAMTTRATTRWSRTATGSASPCRQDRRQDLRGRLFRPHAHPDRRLRRIHPRLRTAAGRHEEGRDARDQRHLPGRLRAGRARQQDRAVRSHHPPRRRAPRMAS